MTRDHHSSREGSQTMWKTSGCAALAGSFLTLSSSLAMAHGEPVAIAHQIAHTYQTGAGSLALGALLAGALIVAAGYGVCHVIGAASRRRAVFGIDPRRR